MTALQRFTLSLGAIAADNYGSATEQAFLAAPTRARNPVGLLRFQGNSGAAQLQAEISGAAEDPSQFPNQSWVTYAAWHNISAVSASQYVFGLAESDPMLPFIRLRVVCEALGVNGAGFEDILLQLLAENY